MSEPVVVSPVDVQRAQLLVRLNRALGAPTPGYVIKIAEAKPTNGTSHHGVNGFSRTLPETADTPHDTTPETD